MVNSVFEWLMIVLVILFYLIIVIAIIAAFFMPLLHWKEIEEKRASSDKSVTTRDYVQELILVVLIPIVMTGLGTLYLFQFFNLKL